MPVTSASAARCELVVTEADTAAALGTGDVPVLATPRVVPAVRAGHAGRHRGLIWGLGRPRSASASRSPTWPRYSVGSTVVATATLERLRGPRLVFNISVTDACGLVAAGRVTRVLVDTSAFMEKAR